MFIVFQEEARLLPKPESLHRATIPEVSLLPFGVTAPSVLCEEICLGHEGTQQRAGVSVAKNEDGNEVPCIETAKNCTKIHKNVKNVVFRAVCLCLVCLHILDSQFQEYCLRGQGTLMPSMKVFLEVLICP